MDSGECTINTARYSSVPVVENILKADLTKKRAYFVYNMNKYTPEQIKDIEEREKKALEALKSLELTPAAVLSKMNVGDDMFVDKVTPYLRDTKYAEKPPVAIDKKDVA